MSLLTLAPKAHTHLSKNDATKLDRWIRNNCPGLVTNPKAYTRQYREDMHFKAKTELALPNATFSGFDGRLKQLRNPKAEAPATVHVSMSPSTTVDVALTTRLTLLERVIQEQLPEAYARAVKALA